MDNLGLWIVKDMPSRPPKAMTPIHVAKEHGKGLIQISHLLQNLPPHQKAGPLGLIHQTDISMLKIPHLPVVKNPAPGEQTAESQELKEDVPVIGKAPAGGLNIPIGVQKLRGYRSNFRIFS